MSRFRCFDVVSAVTDEATKRFAPLYQEDGIKKQQLQRCCNGIDALAERFHGEVFAIAVDDITKDITVTLYSVISAAGGLDEFYLTGTLRVFPSKKETHYRLTESHGMMQNPYVQPAHSGFRVASRLDKPNGKIKIHPPYERCPPKIISGRP